MGIDSQGAAWWGSVHAKSLSGNIKGKRGFLVNRQGGTLAKRRPGGIRHHLRMLEDEEPDEISRVESSGRMELGFLLKLVLQGSVPMGLGRS